MAQEPSPIESAAALEAALEAALRLFTRIDEAASRAPLRADGWCARETVGHLIDSACNNHRRFVVGQSSGVDRFDGYDTNAWVRLQQARERPWQALVELWVAYNRHLVHVMRRTPTEAARASALAPEGSRRVTLAYLMADYVSHLTHHVGQIQAFVESQVPRWPVGPVVDATTARMPERATLAGRRHDFEPIDPDRHVSDLFAGSHASQGEGMWTYLPYGPFADAEAMREWLGSCASSRDPLFLAVVDRATGRAVGMCSLMRFEPGMRTIELGHIWYVPGSQGTGVNADMADTLLMACFERWGYRRAEWKCDSFNTRSRAAALKLGFTFEGIFRQHMVYKGRNRDTAWFSMLDGEWPAAKRALKSLLAR